MVSTLTNQIKRYEIFDIQSHCLKLEAISMSWWSFPNSKKTSQNLSVMHKNGFPYHRFVPLTTTCTLFQSTPPRGLLRARLICFIKTFLFLFSVNIFAGIKEAERLKISSVLFVPVHPSRSTKKSSPGQSSN